MEVFHWVSKWISRNYKEIWDFVKKRENIGYMLGGSCAGGIYYIHLLHIPEVVWGGVIILVKWIGGFLTVGLGTATTKIVLQTWDRIKSKIKFFNDGAEQKQDKINDQRRA